MSAFQKPLVSYLLVAVVHGFLIAHCSVPGPGRFLAACPLYAADSTPDSGGDCICPPEKPICHESGRPWCSRNDGRRDLHYFGMSCETCACLAEGEKSSDMQSFCHADGIDGTLTPNAFGICTCPDDKPICVKRVNMDELQGCHLPSGELASDTRQFSADCENCVCRMACPAFARFPFADAFGDCSCPQVSPTCYESGVKGCASSSPSSVSVSYFRASCGALCECEKSIGACEPASCATTADCGYNACRDCNMCEGISRCPDEAGAVSEFPDKTGNCDCAASDSCFQGSDATPGCPTAPLGINSPSTFRATCRACRCRSRQEIRQDLATSASCPEFARDLAPDRHGNCICPSERADCYQGGYKWCVRNDQGRDLHYFSVRCTDCTCELSAEIAERASQRPCPAFAGSSISDLYMNCVCPPAKPLCVDNKGDRSNLKGRVGPLCPTTHGWNSSMLFRYDCSTCYCEEVAGEGSRFERIRSEQLLIRDDDEYMKHFLVVDLRLVGEVLNRLDEVERVMIKSGFDAWIAAVVASVKDTQTAGAVIDTAALIDTTIYDDAGLEPVLALRVRLDFGIMWTEDFSKTLRPAANLSSRETSLLQNLPAIFGEHHFKDTFDFDMQRHLNGTWSAQDGSTTSAASTNSSVFVEAPRVETTRVIVDSAPEDLALTYIGPLAPLPPVRRTTASSEALAAEEEDLPIMMIVMGAGGVVGFYALSCLCYCSVKFLSRRRARRRQSRAAHGADGIDSVDTPSSAGGDFAFDGSARGRPKIDWKLVRKLGDLAGHKTMSLEARAVIQDEYDEREREHKRKSKKSWRKSRVAGGSVKSPSDGAFSPRQGAGDESPSGSPRDSPGSGEGSDSDSPRSPRSPRLSDSPRSPRGGDSGELFDEEDRKKKKRWWRKKKSEKEEKKKSEKDEAVRSASTGSSQTPPPKNKLMGMIIRKKQEKDKWINE